MFLSARRSEPIYMRVFTRERGNEGNLPVRAGGNKPTNKACLMLESQALITDEEKQGCKSPSSSLSLFFPFDLYFTLHIKMSLVFFFVFFLLFLFP